MKAHALLCCLFLPLALTRAEEPAVPSARGLWADYDPRAEPLEITVSKSWDEGAIHIEQLAFTGETWQDLKVRVFAYRGEIGRAHV